MKKRTRITVSDDVRDVPERSSTHRTLYVLGYRDIYMTCSGEMTSSSSDACMYDSRRQALLERDAQVTLVNDPNTRISYLSLCARRAVVHAPRIDTTNAVNASIGTSKAYCLMARKTRWYVDEYMEMTYDFSSAMLFFDYEDAVKFKRNLVVDVGVEIRPCVVTIRQSRYEGLLVNGERRYEQLSMS